MTKRLAVGIDGLVISLKDYFFPVYAVRNTLFSSTHRIKPLFRPFIHESPEHLFIQVLAGWNDNGGAWVVILYEGVTYDNDLAAPSVQRYIFIQPC